MSRAFSQFETCSPVSGLARPKRIHVAKFWTNQRKAAHAQVAKPHLADCVVSVLGQNTVRWIRTRSGGKVPLRQKDGHAMMQADIAMTTRSFARYVQHKARNDLSFGRRILFGESYSHAHTYPEEH